MKSLQPSDVPDSASFSRFAETADNVRATAKRLEKARLVGNLFETLADSDLAPCARYMAGYTFPLSDQRTTRVGGSALFTAILALTGVTADDAQRRLVNLGDLGDLAAELVAESRTQPMEPALRIADVAAAMDELAESSGSKRKAEQLARLLERASPSEARYLVKLLAGDLRIGLQEGAVEDAIARWTGIPIAQVQWANMLIGDIGQAAIKARAGTLGSAAMRLFHPLKFMLATPAADTKEVARLMPPAFVVEDKYDGIRAQAHVALSVPAHADAHGVSVEAADGRAVHVALFSRTLDDITRSFPDLTGVLISLLPPDSPSEGGIILDGEILAMNGDRILKFRDLQSRLGQNIPSAELLAAVPVTFVAYDLLQFGDSLKIDLPFRERRAILDSLPAPPARFLAAPSRTFTDPALLDAEFEAARLRGNEGLMVKDPESHYTPGRRGREWLKIKRAMATLDVVVTAVEVGHGRRSKVLSDYTFAVRASESDPTLLNVGKAYSGLTDAEIAALSEWFREHTLQEFAHGRVRVVEASVVIEVTFDLVQPSARHKSGYALRFPRIVRVRTDKPASEIDTLATVVKLAES